MINTTRRYNNWYPETQAFIDRLVAAGFTITGGNNGEYRFPNNKHLVVNLCACDEAQLAVVAPDGKKCNIYLILGNEPGVIAADYSVHPALDAAVDAHYNEWSEKAQPTLSEDEYKARMDAERLVSQDELTAKI